ncbi:hypothetical protein CHS0354_011345 [Potamilus streckersoni]|uniref:Uncharacterized protein n=1 Tax=Potamilus streckersoni TaxID=2493646 RepID=A0AAE0TF32_9BIVA|nr:hypothetical protein CHS0354_011345 [Potamilus streckersoni]
MTYLLSLEFDFTQYNSFNSTRRRWMETVFLESNPFASISQFYLCGIRDTILAVPVVAAALCPFVKPLLHGHPPFIAERLSKRPM